MSQKERLLGRLGKIGSQVFISATSMRQEMEALSVEKLEQLARRLNLVRRGEFESVQAMVKEMRQVQEELRSRLLVLERAQGINSSLRNKSLKKKIPVKSADKRRAK
jgi:BMFP domain-containing protein YqiC